MRRIFITAVPRFLVAGVVLLLPAPGFTETNDGFHRIDDARRASRDARAAGEADRALPNYADRCLRVSPPGTPGFYGGIPEEDFNLLVDSILLPQPAFSATNSVAYRLNYLFFILRNEGLISPQFATRDIATVKNDLLERLKACRTGSVNTNELTTAFDLAMPTAFTDLETQLKKQISPETKMTLATALEKFKKGNREQGAVEKDALAFVESMKAAGLISQQPGENIQAYRVRVWNELVTATGIRDVWFGEAPTEINPTPTAAKHKLALSKAVNALTFDPKIEARPNGDGAPQTTGGTPTPDSRDRSDGGGTRGPGTGTEPGRERDGGTRDRKSKNPETKDPEGERNRKGPPDYPNEDPGGATTGGSDPGDGGSPGGGGGGGGGFPTNGGNGGGGPFGQGGLFGQGGPLGGLAGGGGGGGPSIQIQNPGIQPVLIPQPEAPQPIVLPGNPEGGSADGITQTILGDIAARRAANTAMNRFYVGAIESDIAKNASVGTQIIQAMGKSLIASPRNGVATAGPEFFARRNGIPFAGVNSNMVTGYAPGGGRLPSASSLRGPVPNSLASQPVFQAQGYGGNNNLGGYGRVPTAVQLAQSQALAQQQGRLRGVAPATSRRGITSVATSASAAPSPKSKSKSKGRGVLKPKFMAPSTAH